MVHIDLDEDCVKICTQWVPMSEYRVMVSLGDVVREAIAEGYPPC